MGVNIKELREAIAKLMDKPEASDLQVIRIKLEKMWELAVEKLTKSQVVRDKECKEYKESMDSAIGGVMGQVDAALDAKNKREELAARVIAAQACADRQSPATFGDMLQGL